MTREENSWSALGRKIVIAIFANLLAFFISAISFFFIAWLLRNVTSEQSRINLLAGSAALVLWCISCGLFVLLTRYGEPLRNKLKYLGYYFPPTTLFVWALDQRKGKLVAQEEVARLKRIIKVWPVANIVEKIINPVSRKEGLEAILSSMNDMGDHELALIIRRILSCIEDIIELAENGEKYNLFRRLNNIS